jgi:predicted nucleic acid-binding protein
LVASTLEPILITLDTSGLLALIDSRDPDHGRASRVLLSDPGPRIVPVGILGEVSFMLEQHVGPRFLDLFLGDIESGAYTLDCGESDVPRIRALVQRYANLPLGFADASVVACAERRGGRVLTLDLRDFDVVAGEGKIQVLPGHIET